MLCPVCSKNITHGSQEEGYTIYNPCGCTLSNTNGLDEVLHYFEHCGETHEPVEIKSNAQWHLDWALYHLKRAIENIGVDNEDDV